MDTVSEGGGTLGDLVADLAAGRIRVIDLTQTLSPDMPPIVLPPEMGQCWPFRREEISRYDERGPSWYWNNFSCGEHTGTHFDAPIHWISGQQPAEQHGRHDAGGASRRAGLRHRLRRAKRRPMPISC